MKIALKVYQPEMCPVKAEGLNRITMTLQTT